MDESIVRGLNEMENGQPPPPADRPAYVVTEGDPLLLEEPLLPPPQQFAAAAAAAEPSFRLTSKGEREQSQENQPNQQQGSSSIRRVEYDNDSHLSVLFQMYGSVWPQVFPYCVATVLLTYAVFFLHHHDFVALGFPTSTGHNFMAIMVSFLVVTRASITYSRFMEAREYLSICFRTCREVAHHTCVLTMHDTSEGATQWRREVAYRTILLLRVTMSAIDYKTSNVHTWDVLASDDHENLEVLTPTGGGGGRRSNVGSRQGGDGGGPVVFAALTPQMERMSQWAHGVRTVQDENMRAPIVLAYNLRDTILKQRNGEYLQKDMHVNEELKILGFVSEFIAAFHGLNKLITTPFPFPLVQMTRTFLFFWVFSLPFVLVDQMDQPVWVMLIMFFLTYGFLGLEYVSIEMEDPFGNDPNDFDNQGMSQVVFEDIYIAIYKMDGKQSALELRDKVLAHQKKGSAMFQYHHRPEKASSGSLHDSFHAKS